MYLYYTSVFISFWGFLFFLRCVWICWRIHKIRNNGCETKRKQNVKTLIVAGSGGHTTEILKLTRVLTSRYVPRIYLIANTDVVSESKIKEVENNRSDFSICRIPRSREVHQSWLTTVITTIYSTLWVIPVVLGCKPDLVLCNGPGTCIPVCIICFLMKALFIQDIKIIYVESICRVTSLSLSARILYLWADQLVVQWPELKQKYPRTVYLGRLS